MKVATCSAPHYFILFIPSIPSIFLTDPIRQASIQSAPRALTEPEIFLRVVSPVRKTGRP